MDDSIIFRSGILKALTGQVGIEVVGSAANGKIALDKIKQLKPDIITMDLEMPIMDGISTIKEIRKDNKNLGILVFSDQSEVAARKTFEALAAGADDFIPKSIVKGEGDSVELIRKELVPKINQFKDRLFKRTGIVPTVSKTSINSIPDLNIKNSKIKRSDLIVLGCSTGGPEALRNIFKNLVGYKGPPILIVQHMPPVFTEQLAKLLTTASGWSVKEAKEGDLLQKDICYIAPGDYHMKLVKGKDGYAIQLNQEEKVKSVRPAVDVLFKSVADNYIGQVLSIIMTGMGDDGLDGIKCLKQKGSQVVIQDKESSVVWGMPGAIFAANLFDSIVPLDEISKIIKDAVLGV